MRKMQETFARIYSGQPRHLRGLVVVVEVDISKGIHSFSIVGLADRAVDEAKDRVSSALKHSGFRSPKSSNLKTIVSLAPAKIKKSGSHFDIAIALGFCIASRKIDGFTEFSKTPRESFSESMFVGELSLNGEVKPVEGILSIIQVGKESGFNHFFIPEDNCKEASLVLGVTIFPIKRLADLLSHVTSAVFIEPYQDSELDLVIEKENLAAIDISDIKGQDIAKRALLISAAGLHNITLTGPPGTGKTMLAKAFRGILPPLTQAQSLEVTGIYSSIDILKEPLKNPPFRSPHHTASYASIIGGGHTIKPGEITLAHNGVLFLDEFPEFERRVIESLRQPMENGFVSIARSNDRAVFPCDFILIAAMNPCPCGFKGYSKLNCTCNQAELYRYQKKLSGPIIDRIDLWVNVDHISYEELSTISSGEENSQSMKLKVVAARKIQRGRSGTKLNSQLSAREISKLEKTSAAEKLLIQAATKLQLSPRSYHRILKIARTISDLEGVLVIDTPSILEALQYRKKETT